MLSLKCCFTVSFRVSFRQNKAMVHKTYICHICSYEPQLFKDVVMHLFYRLFINKEEDIMTEKGELNSQAHVFRFSSDS